MIRCETCCGEGTVIEFRRFAGEYQAGEPVEVPCPDCDGEDEEPCAPPKLTAQQIAEYEAWCREVDQLTECRGDPMQRKDEAA